MEKMELRGDDREARMRASEILAIADRGTSAAWSAARQIVEECSQNPALGKQIPQQLRDDLIKLLELHERSVSHEYVQDVVTQALNLERSVSLTNPLLLLSSPLISSPSHALT